MKKLSGRHKSLRNIQMSSHNSSSQSLLTSNSPINNNPNHQENSSNTIIYCSDCAKSHTTNSDSSGDSSTTTLLPSIPNSISFREIYDNTTVASLPTIGSSLSSTKSTMSGGMEDAHDDDRQQRFNAETRQSNQSNPSYQSNNYEQGQLIDFQAMIEDNTAMADIREFVSVKFASADERFEKEYHQDTATKKQADEEAINKTAADLRDFSEAIINAQAKLYSDNSESVPGSVKGPPISKAPTAVPPTTTPPATTTFTTPQATDNPLSAMFGQFTKLMTELKSEIKDLRSDFARERAEDKAEFNKKLDNALKNNDHPPITDIKVPSPSIPSPSTTTKTYASTAATSQGPPSPTNFRTNSNNNVSRNSHINSPSRNSRFPFLGPAVNKPFLSPAVNKHLGPVSDYQSRNIVGPPSLTRKYAQIDPAEHNVNIQQGLFPIGTLYEDKPEEDEDLLWIRCFGYNKNVAKFRTDEDTSDFSYEPVGNWLVEACNIANNKQGRVVLERAYEVESNKNASNDRCVGQLAIRFIPEYHLTTEEKLHKLKEIAQTVILNETYFQVNIDELPDYVQAFKFEVNAVNYPHQVPFALVIGLSANWNIRLDRFGYDRLMDDLFAQLPADEQGLLPKPLRTYSDRTSTLGALQYTSSAVINGKNGKGVCVAYACTPKGYQAALKCYETLNGASDIQVYGKIPVTISCFPPRTQPSPNRQIKTSKPSGDPVKEFAKASLKQNTEFTSSNYYTIVLADLTDQIFQRKTAIDMCANYDHLVGIVPRCIKSTNTNNSLDNQGLLVLRHNSSTTTRPSTFYRNMFESTVPSIFPITANNNEDDNDFKIVTNSKHSAKVSATKGDISEIMRNLDNKLHEDTNSNGRVWVVTWGRGGPRGAGIYPVYLNGIHGAKYMFDGISGGHCKAFDNENDAFKYFQQFYPGIDSWAKLRILWSCVPHNAHNLHPLYPEYTGKIHHRFNADAFPCVETDDDELLTERINATTFVTGQPNGQPNERFHYHRMLQLLRQKLHDQYHGKPTDPNDPPTPDNQSNFKVDQGTPESNEDLFGDYPNTQDEDFQDAQEDQYHEMDDEPTDQEAPSPNSAKKRKVINDPETQDRRYLPTPDPKHHDRPDLNGMTWNTADNNDTFRLNFIIVSLPPIATLNDALSYFHGFKPGFGNWIKDQSKLCTYWRFPNCKCVIVGCPLDSIGEFRHFVTHNRIFKKYKIFTAIPNSHDDYRLLTPDEHQEEMALHPLIVHAKTVNHPDHDHLLEEKIKESTNAQQVFDYFTDNLSKDSIDDNTRRCDDWRFPAASTKFYPNTYENDFSSNPTHPESKGIGSYSAIDEHF